MPSDTNVIPLMDENKSKALAAALAQIEKQFGKGSIMRMDAQAAPDVQVVSTGSLGLDVALGVGGLPRGRVVEVYGPESSGKTTLCLQVVAEIQKAGGTAAYIDAENALDPQYAAKLGVRIDDLLISQPDTGEQGLEIVGSQTYVDPGTYYNDFVAGRFDCCIGSWDTFVARYLQGVPIRLLATMTTADMVGILVRGDGPRSVAELRGKQLAAPKATGTYRLTSLLLKRFHKLELENDIPVLNVPSPATAVTYLLADRADGALGWEPSLSIGLQKRPDARLLYNLGEDWRAQTKESLYFFAIAVQKGFLDRHPGVDQRLIAAMRRTGDEFNRNFDEAITIAARSWMKGAKT